MIAAQNMTPQPESVAGPRNLLEKRDGNFLLPLGDATVLDNYLILKTKERNFAGVPEKFLAVQTEIAEYQPMIDALVTAHPELASSMDELGGIHNQLWHIEDRKRAIEQAEATETMTARLLEPQNKGALVEYLGLSRDISRLNDIRAQIKRKMNTLTGSKIVEVKSHKTVS